MAGVGGHHIGHHLIRQLFDHTVGHFIIDVPHKVLAAQGNGFIGNLDALLDVFGLQLHHAQGQIFLGHGGRAFGVYIRAVRAALKGALEIAAEVGLAHPLQQLIIVPGGFDNAVHQRGHGHLAVGGSVQGQESAALIGLAGQDIVLIRFGILGAGAHFLGVVLAGFVSAALHHDAGGAVGDLAAGFRGLLGGLLDLGGVLTQLVHFLLQGLQIGALLLHLLEDGGLPGFNFLHGLVLHFSDTSRNNFDLFLDPRLRLFGRDLPAHFRDNSLTEGSGVYFSRVIGRQ